MEIVAVIELMANSSSWRLCQNSVLAQFCLFLLKSSQLMKLSKQNIEKYNELYNSRYQKYGFSPRTLGWYTGKQNFRFNVASRDFGEDICSVLDIGCGFADLYIYLNSVGRNVKYTGIDLNEKFLREAQRNIEKNALSIPNLIQGDVLDISLPEKYDAVLAIGITSLLLSDQDNYEYIESIIAKGYDLANSVFVIDFCSDSFNRKTLNYGFVYDPIKVLQIANKFTNRLSLHCDYFPTEFMLKMYKDNSYNTSFIYNHNIYDHE